MIEARASGGARPATASPVMPIVWRMLSYGALTTLAVLCLVPFVWMMLTALKPENEVMTNPPRLLPSVLAWGNFPRAFSFYPFGRFLLNTGLVAVSATALQTAVAVLAADAFARLRFPGRH